MAIREIVWTVSEDASGILPSTVQNGGVQGEHNATRSIWVIGKDSPLTNPEYSLYVECTDTTGGEPDHQGPLTIEDGKVSVLLPLAWTQYGGVSTMRLVAEKTESKSEKVITLECRVSFDSRPAGPKGDGVMRGFLQAMLDETQAAREAAFYYREAAGSSAREADTAMREAKAATADARFLMQKSEANVTAAGESATAAEEAAETATQAAGSASESELAARSAVDDAQAAARRAEEAAEQAEENGGIDTSDFVKNTDYATYSTAGLVTPQSWYGLQLINHGISSDKGQLGLINCTKAAIDGKDSNGSRTAITCSMVDYAVKVGLTTNTETLTPEEQAAAQAWLGIDLGDMETALDSIIAIQESLIGGGLITFTVNGTEYQAEHGMTWGEWCESEHCPTDNFKATSDNVNYYEASITQPSGGVAINNKFVKLTDPIIDNGSYVVTTSAEY